MGPVYISRPPVRISRPRYIPTQLATASIPEFHADNQTRGWSAIIDMEKPIASSLTRLYLPLNKVPPASGSPPTHLDRVHELVKFHSLKSQVG